MTEKDRGHQNDENQEDVEFLALVTVRQSQRKVNSQYESEKLDAVSNSEYIRGPLATYKS